MPGVPKDSKGAIPPLSRLGKAIDDARRSDEDLPKQEVFAKRLQESLQEITKSNDAQVSLSFVTRLIRGSIVDPSPALLRAIAQVLNLEYEYLVALLVQEKYELEPEKLYSLSSETLTLDQLADWEAHHDHREVWIVATKFVDRYQNQFRRAVHTIVGQGGEVTFFIPRSLKDQIESYQRGVLQATGAGASAFTYVGLKPDQVAVMAASYVIANPPRAQALSDNADGYVILHNDNGDPVVALKMSSHDILDRVEILSRMRQEALNDVAIDSPSSALLKKSTRRKS